MDFEAFLCGALLIKPDIAAALADAAGRGAPAARGQALYRHYIASEQGYEEFCLRFREIVDAAVRASVVG